MSAASPAKYGRKRFAGWVARGASAASPSGFDMFIAEALDAAPPEAAPTHTPPPESGQQVAALSFDDDFTGVRDAAQRPAPLPGADTRGICRDILGMDDEAIDRQIADGVLFESARKEVPL